MDSLGRERELVRERQAREKHRDLNPKLQRTPSRGHPPQYYVEKGLIIDLVWTKCSTNGYHSTINKYHLSTFNKEKSRE